MSNIRQSILIRMDLNLPKGLSEAQVAHLHANQAYAILNHIANGGTVNLEDCFHMSITDIKSWLQTPYTFVHGVPNADVLRHFVTIANNLKVPYTEWRDTVFLKVSKTQQITVENCLIGITLGPFESDKIKAVIGDLPLFK